MKKLLHMGAMSVVSGKGEMANYYHRKVEQGKNEMLVLNAAAGARCATKLSTGFLLAFETIETGSPGDMKKFMLLPLFKP